MSDHKFKPGELVVPIESRRSLSDPDFLWGLVIGYKTHEDWGALTTVQWNDNITCDENEEYLKLFDDSCCSLT